MQPFLRSSAALSPDCFALLRMYSSVASEREMPSSASLPALSSLARIVHRLKDEDRAAHVTV